VVYFFRDKNMAKDHENSSKVMEALIAMALNLSDYRPTPYDVLEYRAKILGITPKALIEKDKKFGIIHNFD
jgi:hypothetical protein